jgi:hypothetical protein
LLLDAAIKGALDKTYRFWTAGGGKSVWVIVAYHNGNPYVKKLRRTAFSRTIFLLCL